MKKNVFGDDRKSRSALSRRDALLALGGGVGAVGATILIGCGGGGSDSAGQSGTGRATMTIVWPSTEETSRLIPTASQSIVVNILQNSQVVATQTVARPSTGTTSTVTFASLPVGTLPVQVQAYPNSDGTGTVQASATSSIDIIAGQSTALTVTMASTIDHVTLTAAASSITVGGATTLTLTALDASGAIVLISTSTVTFTALSSSIATVDSSGAVTGVSVGTASFRAIETESGKAATVTLTVTAAATPTPSPSPSVTSCTLIPQETQGPYPLLSVLSNSAIVRQNITEGKTGVPLTLNLTFVNVGDTCGPVTNAAIYIWHCDKDGEYSGYSSSQNGNHAGETYLRGIQVSDSAGQVSFSTIYPGWYMGRATHIHAQVYLNDNLKVTATVTTQFAFPEATNATVYASTLYAAHGQNTSVPSNAGDNVFSDGTTYQMLTLSGDVSSGFVATLHLGIAA